MQHAGLHQYGQGAANSHQSPPFAHAEISQSVGGNTTSSLRQFRKKDGGVADKQPTTTDLTTSIPENSHIARVPPHNHYPARPNEFYRYHTPQYPDFSTPYKETSQVKYSEIAEQPQTLQHVDHLPAALQKQKEKEFMDMCNITQQTPHMKQNYPDNLARQQSYPGDQVHHQYLHKEPQIHPSYKPPESQYQQYAQMPPKYPNVSPQQCRKYPQPENDFLAKLQRIHPSMARSIMSDHHIREAQGGYPAAIDQNRMYSQNQRYHYPMQNNSAYPPNYHPIPQTYNYPASCNYKHPSPNQMPPMGMGRYPTTERSISPRRNYQADNMGMPVNYGAPQKISPTYNQYNPPEYAQHYQHRRTALSQEFYQQTCRPGQYLGGHQMSPEPADQRQPSGLRHYLENWAEEEVAAEAPMFKDTIRGHAEESPNTEQVYVINSTDIPPQYIEGLSLVPTENGQFIIKGGGLDNPVVRIVDKEDADKTDKSADCMVVSAENLTVPSQKRDCGNDSKELDPIVDAQKALEEIVGPLPSDKGADDLKDMPIIEPQVPPPVVPEPVTDENDNKCQDSATSVIVSPQDCTTKVKRNLDDIIDSLPQVARCSTTKRMQRIFSVDDIINNIGGDGDKQSRRSSLQLTPLLPDDPPSDPPDDDPGDAQDTKDTQKDVVEDVDEDNNDEQVEVQNAISVDDNNVILEIGGVFVQLHLNEFNGTKVLSVLPLSDDLIVDVNGNYQLEDFEQTNTVEEDGIEDTGSTTKIISPEDVESKTVQVVEDCSMEVQHESAVVDVVPEEDSELTLEEKVDEDDGTAQDGEDGTAHDNGDTAQDTDRAAQDNDGTLQHNNSTTQDNDDTAQDDYGTAQDKNSTSEDKDIIPEEVDKSSVLEEVFPVKTMEEMDVFDVQRTVPDQIFEEGPSPKLTEEQPSNRDSPSIAISDDQAEDLGSVSPAKADDYEEKVEYTVSVVEDLEETLAVDEDPIIDDLNANEVVIGDESVDDDVYLILTSDGDQVENSNIAGIEDCKVLTSDSGEPLDGTPGDILSETPGDIPSEPPGEILDKTSIKTPPEDDNIVNLKEVVLNECKVPTKVLLDPVPPANKNISKSLNCDYQAATKPNQKADDISKFTSNWKDKQSRPPNKERTKDRKSHVKTSTSKPDKPPEEVTSTVEMTNTDDLPPAKPNKPPLISKAAKKLYDTKVTEASSKQTIAKDPEGRKREFKLEETVNKIKVMRELEANKLHPKSTKSPKKRVTFNLEVAEAGTVSSTIKMEQEDSNRKRLSWEEYSSRKRKWEGDPPKKVTSDKTVTSTFDDDEVSIEKVERSIENEITMKMLSPLLTSPPPPPPPAPTPSHKITFDNCWEEVESPRPSQSSDVVLMEKVPPPTRCIIDVNEFNIKPMELSPVSSSQFSEDDSLQVYKNVVDSKLNSLNIQIPKPAAKVKPLDSNAKKVSVLIKRFLSKGVLNGSELEKVKKIIEYKRLVEEEALQKAKKQLTYEVRTGQCDYSNSAAADKDLKLHFRKISQPQQMTESSSSSPPPPPPSKPKRKRFRNLYADDTTDDDPDEDADPNVATLVDNYSVFQRNSQGVPKLIFKRKSGLPQPFVKLERSHAVDLLAKKRKTY